MRCSREARYLIAVFTPSTGQLDAWSTPRPHGRAHRRDDRRGDPWMTGAARLSRGRRPRQRPRGDGCTCEASLAVRPIERVMVSSPTPERREAFAARGRRPRFDAEALADGTRPLRPPTHRASSPPRSRVRAARPPRRLARARRPPSSPSARQHPCCARSTPASSPRRDLIVGDTEQAAAECGDMIAAEQRRHRLRRAARSRCTTCSPAASPLGARRAHGVFKSVGGGLQDLVAAEAVARARWRRGLGRELDIVSPKTFRDEELRMADYERGDARAVGAGAPDRLLERDDPDVHRRTSSGSTRTRSATTSRWAIEHGFTYTLLVTETASRPRRTRGSRRSRARRRRAPAAVLPRGVRHARGQHRGGAPGRAGGRRSRAAGVPAAVLADDASRRSTTTPRPSATRPTSA